MLIREAHAVDAAAIARVHVDSWRTTYAAILADNPSRGFYETLGARRITEKAAKVGGIEVVEVAYGWSNLRDLV